MKRALGTIVLLLLATARQASADPVAPRPPDATYFYVLTYNGTAIGTSTVAVDGSKPGAVVVKESADFSMPALKATATMRYDPATLRETTYSADFDLPNGPQHTDVTVKPGTVNVVAVPGGSSDIPADPSAPLELIGDNLAGSAMLLPAILHATGAQAFTVAVLTGGQALVAKVLTDATPTRPSSVPTTDVSLCLQFAGMNEIFWYDPTTYVVHDVAIPAQEAEFRLTSTTALGVASRN
jgi:hypothetical protein